MRRLVAADIIASDYLTTEIRRVRANILEKTPNRGGNLPWTSIAFTSYCGSLKALLPVDDDDNEHLQECISPWVVDNMKLWKEGDADTFRGKLSETREKLGLLGIKEVDFNSFQDICNHLIL